MTDRSQPKVANGEPFAGDLVAVVDESAHGAGGGVYYVVGGAVVLEPVSVTGQLRGLIAERERVLHWATAASLHAEVSMSCISKPISTDGPVSAVPAASAVGRQRTGNPSSTSAK